MHSGNLLSVRLSAPFSLVVNNHVQVRIHVPKNSSPNLASAFEVNSPNPFAGAPIQLGICFNSVQAQAS
jgi:hypothetical protein